MMKNLMNDFINFIKKPDLNKFAAISTKQKLKKLLKLYLLTLFFAFLINSLNNLLIIIGLYDEYSQNISNLPKLVDNNIIKTYLIFGLFFPPAIEEFTFRLLLAKFNKKYIDISISLIFGLIIYLYLNNILWYPQLAILTNIIAYLYPVLFALPIYIVLSFFYYNLKTIWNNKFPFFFYFFTILFAIFHILRLN